jgi:hypothetical protein
VAKAIFIGATGQNVGKTTISLGIFASLKKRYGSVGFIKPVGQHHEEVENGMSVDKDVVLFKKQFHLESDWRTMSPVLIPSGFTRGYLDGQFSTQAMEDSVLKAFNEITEANDITIVEGTGHVGVGSIINMSNAKVAALLDVEMIIVASAGLGSTFDELALNIALCEQWGVKVKGVILNRVHDDKRDMILDYMPKALERWNVPVLGVIPYSPYLNSPCMADFEISFKTKMISGIDQKYRHFANVRLVAGSVDHFEADFNPEELVITPASREDVVEKGLALICAGKRLGFLLTSRHPPTDSLVALLREHNVPALYAPLCSYDAMKHIVSLISKIRIDDREKVAQAIELVEDNLDKLVSV